MIGREMAARAMEQYGTTDLQTIVQREGLVIRELHPWKARFQEAYVYPQIFVPRNLPSPEFRTRVAHALGHHFLHEGNQVWLRGLDRIWNWRQEHQAEEFASYLLVPETDEMFLWGLSVESVAKAYSVTEDLVQVRVQGR